MWSRRLGCPRSAICKLETQRSWRWWCCIRGRRLLNQQHGCGRVCRPEDPSCGGAVPAGPGLRLCSSGMPSYPHLSVLRGPGRVGDAPPHWGPACVWADRWLNCALRLQPPQETLSRMLRNHVQPKTQAAVTQSTRHIKCTIPSTTNNSFLRAISESACPLLNSDESRRQCSDENITVAPSSSGDAYKIPSNALAHPQC